MLKAIRRLFAAATVSVVVKLAIGATVVAGLVWFVPVGIEKLSKPMSAKPGAANPSRETTKRPLTRDDEPSAPSAYAQTTKFAASDAAINDQFGFAVAANAETVISSSSRDDNYIGSAYVFVRNGASWSQQQKLVGSDSVIEDNFGWSVAIDGDTAVVGANLDDGSATDQGSAYVFVRSGATWTQQAKLTAGDAAANDQFGISVAISGDTIVVGASNDDTFRGSAYVFVRNGTTWSQQQKLTASDGAADDEFGWSVGVNGDSAVGGAYRDDGGRGSAYVFTRSGAVWSQQQKLTASDGVALDQFGYSVAINANTVISGATFDDTGGALLGSAYVFTRRRLSADRAR